jgi:hypothetical protein
MLFGNIIVKETTEKNKYNYFGGGGGWWGWEASKLLFSNVERYVHSSHDN